MLGSIIGGAIGAGHNQAAADHQKNSTLGGNSVTSKYIDTILQNPVDSGQFTDEFRKIKENEEQQVKQIMNLKHFERLKGAFCRSFKGYNLC